LDDRPFNLIFDAVGVDGLAAIVSSYCAAAIEASGGVLTSSTTVVWPLP
jgi:hypothetical protein